MRRVAWVLLFAFIMGMGTGLAYSWMLAPRQTGNARPSNLHPDFKDQYRSVIAAAYAATGNLPRAEARLRVLDDANPIDALHAQAQRMLASSQTFEQADRLVELAAALENKANGKPVSTPTFEMVINAGNTFTPSLPPGATDLSFSITETPELIETATNLIQTFPATIEATLRPTITRTPEPGDPFLLTGQETLCEPNLSEGLLQVLVMNPSRRQLAGVEIVITWEGGKEQFFTGLKPELGNGYADYTMTPDTLYTVQLARGSDVAVGVSAPTCQSAEGAAFLGGIKLTFQQP